MKRTRISSGHVTAEVMEYGAILSDLRLAGVAHGLTLSLPTLGAYQADGAHVGAIAGPVAGRIGGGRFMVDGVEYHTTRNEGPNTLHGGARGFGRRAWSLRERRPDAVELVLHWPDGAEGFPGPIEVTCRYQVLRHALHIEMQATAQRPTLCNLAQHSYFNLADAGVIDDHVLEISSDRVTPFGPDLLPTGGVEPVSAQTDFRVARRIADTRLDHHFALSEVRQAPAFAARLSAGNVAMTMRTTEPGLVVYTADKLDSPPHGPRSGICLEPQGWPNAINTDGFPSPILMPGEVYRQETIMKFEV